jgi:hypothetical protein
VRARSDEERVALRIHLRAGVLRKRRPQQRSMRGEHIAVLLLQPLHELGRVGDVGKEKRDGSTGQFDHGSILSHRTVW